MTNGPHTEIFDLYVRFGVVKPLSMKFVVCLGCDAVWSGRSIPAFRLTLLFPCLGCKSLCHEDGNRRQLRNDGNGLPNYRTSHTRRLRSS